MLPFYPMIAAGGVAFWVLTVLLVVWVIWESDKDGDWWPGGLFVFCLWAALMATLGPLATFPWLTWSNVGWFLLAYVPIGLGYMAGRWVGYVVTNRSRWQVLLNQYALDHGFPLLGGKIPQQHRLDFTKWWKKHSRTSWSSAEVWRHEAIDLNPKAWEHRHKLTTWAMWWPVSMTRWLLGDVIARVWRRVVKALSGVLTIISGWLWADASDNFVEDEEEPESDPHGIKRMGRNVREAERIIKEVREKGDGNAKLRPAGDDPDAE